MAEQIAHDVVNETQSVDAHASAGIIAHISNNSAAGNGQALPQSNHADNETNERADGVEKSFLAEATDNAEIQANNDTTNESADSVTENAALADTSGGSDSDTSRTDSAEAKDAKGHVRSGSVKKPTTFKSVSVTKNFLAKAATAVPSVRPGDKGPSVGPTPASAPLAAKPRLVAKSALGGAGLRAGISKLNGASGPDASKVWNKNRPMAPAPPKHFTDEELQTRYGIHLATRLQSDEAGKDPKWADIDDDEDDWAPETVEWMDGTKSSVVTADAQPTPPPPEETKIPPAAPLAEAVKPMQLPASKPTPAVPQKTILKPGALAPNQPKSGSLVLKGAPEKPSLVAKPSAPTPAKSPWAPLPPVEKVSPVLINPPVQQVQPSRFQRDPHGFDSLAPASSPAKEIAADDFNRSWRDDRGTKELYNSQSGRYEPVVEGARRGSRQDHTYRQQQPAVLQRPLSQQHGGPAEPSSAFQTSRSTGGDPGSWARRRASSNLSAGSGRRPSIARLQDLPARPDGISPASTVAVESPKQAFATVEHPAQNQGHWTRTSSNANEPEVITEVAPLTNGAVPFEDQVARQQRLMREKIERAKLQKQRQQEEEEKEAAARKERLKQKLAALEVSRPSPELKDTTTRGGSVVAKSPQEPRALPASSPPKPPVPTHEGEIAQYGMMKVHQPHPVRKSGVTEASLTNKQTFDSSEPKQAASPRKQVARPTNQGPPPQIGGEKIPKRLPDATPEKLGASWKSTSPSDLPSWTNTTMNAHSVSGANVWGPPSSNKALGNGTFETHNQFGHSIFDTRQNLHNRQPMPSIAHGPIAPPQGHKNLAVGQPLSHFNNSNFSTRNTSNSTSSVHSGPPNSSILSSPQTNILNTSVEMAPIATLRSPTSTSFPKEVSLGPAHRAPRNSEWEVYSTTTKQKEDGKAEVGLKERAVEKERRIALGLDPDTGKPKEPKATCWISKVRGDRGKIVETTRHLSVDGKEINSWTYPGDHRFDPLDKPDHEYMAKWRAAQTSPPKSRYFGQDTEDIQSDASTTGSDSQPPPEGPAHPAFDGNAAKPVVKMAPPKATVNLPTVKPKTQATAAPAVQPVTPAPNFDVVARINDLFKDKRVTTVKSASKAPLEVAPATAVISLPGTPITIPINHVEKILTFVDGMTTKAMDEDLFEPPEFASKPTVRISNTPHRNHQLGYAHELDYMMPWNVNESQLQAQTVEEVDLFPKQRTIGYGYKQPIRVPGAQETKFVEVNAPKSNGNALNKNRRGFPPKNNGPRKSSGQFGGAQAQAQSPKARSSGNWNNNRSNANANTTSWNSSNKRTTASGAQ